MGIATTDLESAVWAAVDGVATAEQLAALEADPIGHRLAVERLLDETEAHLQSIRRRPPEERELALPEFEELLHALQRTHRELTGEPEPAAAADEPGEVRLQASWNRGEVVVWAGGPGAPPEDNDALSDRLEAIGGPALGWKVHPGVALPDDQKAAALAIPLEESLGWLVACAGGLGSDQSSVGASVTWLGRVALLAVRRVAAGAVAPSLHRVDSGGRGVKFQVRWSPVLIDDAEVTELAAAMPGTVTALGPADPRGIVLDILGEVADSIATTAARGLELPAPPPDVRTVSAVSEAVVTRLDGSVFDAPPAAGTEVAKRLDRWARPVARRNRPTLVVQLDPPDSSDAWFLSVLGPGAEGGLLPIEVALADSRNTAPLADELARLERVLPALLRAGGLRRGQVYLSQPEAWELMTKTGPQLEMAGFEVRVPAISRRKPKPSLRLFTEPIGGSAVGANQLNDVRWTAVFGDVELTAAEIRELAAEAKPLVMSHGRWVELDKADLAEAAAALAERGTKTRMTGAEVLRHAVGLEGNLLAGGVDVEGAGWATDILAAAGTVGTDPVTEPDGFEGTLRSYQAEAVGWLGFLDAAGLGGCLALDMGLGKTPTVLAHLARTCATEGPALVVAPPAVVGNWAAEAARFAPGLRVVVHHGASRAAAEELEAEAARADLLITTYGTAVRDIDALSARTWDRLVLDEAQAIKNSSSDTAQQLRRIDARTKLALTGTPIENGLGDLWSILDFTNPGLVGSRAGFVSQLQGEGEAALRALNGILVFRRTKKEPEVAAELPDKIDELDHCTMTPEQIGLYQAVLDDLVAETERAAAGGEAKQGAILAAITALKQICNHPAAYQDDGRPLAGRSGKLERLEEIVDAVFQSDEKVLVFTHFAEWGKRLADYLTATTGVEIACYHGGLARGARDKLVREFQERDGAGALVLSLKAGGTGLNLTAASHVVLYDRWWNPAVEDQARDRAWRIGQERTVVSHRLVCPGTVDERVEEVVAGKRHIADVVLPKSSSLADLNADQLRRALGLRPDTLLTEEASA